VNTSKRRGTAWESAVVTFLRGKGFDRVERRALAGAEDKGDLAGLPCVVECKATNRLDLAGAVDEAEREAVNAGAPFGVAWLKRRGRASADGGYVVMSGETFAELLRRWDS
jgi:hypothetical protein